MQTNAATQPVVMNPTEALESLNLLFNANKPAMFWGDAGAGKSSMFRGYCRDTGIGLKVYNLSQFEPVDMRGLPSILKNDSGFVTQWSRPDNLPTIERDGPRGIMLYDECNTARHMFPTLMQVFLERVSGEHVLPPGWVPMAAGNYRSAKGVACDMPGPFNNRVAHIDYVPCFRFYTGELAAKIGLHPIIAAYIRFRPHMLSLMPGNQPAETYIPRIAPDARSFPSCRSWESVSDVLKMNPSDSLRQRLVASLVGTDAAADFESFFLVSRDLTPPGEIIARPNDAPIPTTIGMLHAITTALASHATRDNFAAIMTYAKRLAESGHREYYALIGIDATRQTPELKTTAAYVAWLKDNPDYC